MTYTKFTEPSANVKSRIRSWLVRQQRLVKEANGKNITSTTCYLHEFGKMTLTPYFDIFKLVYPSSQDSWSLQQCGRGKEEDAGIVSPSASSGRPILSSLWKVTWRQQHTLPHPHSSDLLSMTRVPTSHRPEPQRAHLAHVISLKHFWIPCWPRYLNLFGTFPGLWNWLAARLTVRNGLHNKKQQLTRPGV